MLFPAVTSHVLAKGAFFLYLNAVLFLYKVYGLGISLISDFFVVSKGSGGRYYEIMLSSDKAYSMAAYHATVLVILFDFIRQH